MTHLDIGEMAAGGGLLGVGSAMGVAGLKLVQAMLARRRTPEQKMGEAAAAASDLIKLALEASGTSVEQLLTEQAALRDRISQLEQSHASCESRCEELTGELRQANQKIDSLRRELERPGATSPGGHLAGAIIELSGDDVTVMPASALALPTGEK